MSKQPDREISNVQGHLAVLRVYPDGKEEPIIEGQNTITNRGKQAISRLVGGAYTGILTAEDWRPCVIILGNGELLAPETATDLAPASVITSLGGSGGDIPLSSYYWRNPNGKMDSSEISIVNDNELQIETLLGPGSPSGWLNDESSGATIAAGSIEEAGLYFMEGDPSAPYSGTAGNLFAYKTFESSIVYNSSTVEFSLLFRWTISFTNP